MIYDIFRWFGILTGYPFRWLFFKDKMYFENERATNRVKGGALVISNHFNTLDFVMNVFVFFPRKLYVVASEYAFKDPIISLGMKFWGGIEANRVTKDVSFILKSIKEIKKGHLVLIFPEGHNTDDGTIKPFYPSYLAIALKSNAPIVPVISDGNYGILKRVHLMVGEPIDVSQYFSSKRPSNEELEKVNAIIYEKVLQLRRELDLRIGRD